MPEFMSLTSDDFQHASLDELMLEADRVRRERSGNTVELCAIVNAKSGRCSMDCRFCAQSVHHKTVIETYPLINCEKLLEATTSNWNRGVQRVGWVTSGCSATDVEVEQLAESAEKHQNSRICVSLGQLSAEALSKLKSAGITRYHHNLETSKRFYPSICSTQNWEDRYKTVQRAKTSGFEVCSGGLFGLGESWADRMELALTLRELEVDSVPLNFLSPIPGTPLGNQPKLTAEEGLRIIMLFRIMLPKATIRICGGRPTTFGDRQSEIFSAGVDALMTGDYLTTSGISVERDLKMLVDCGRRFA